MGRLKLEMPSEYIFTTDMEVRIGDVNYGGHVGNDSILTLAHEARLRFLSEYNYSEKDIEGLGLVMIDAAILFKNQAFRGDKISVDIAINDINRIGFDLYYRLTNTANQKDIAHVKTTMAFFDYKFQKIAVTPENFFTKFVSEN
jgi:acyl-CoA thioester hydrolase